MLVKYIRFMRRKCSVILAILLSCLAVNTVLAQAKSKRQLYVDAYKYAAVKKMLEHGIPASITLAQGLLESGAGKSSLAVKANNHFGIKCHKGWTGDTFFMDDDKKNECFRKYANVEDSYEDHSQFLLTRSRYAFLFKYKRTAYKKWAKGLKKAGYATNPKYAHLLIKIIEEEGLHKYDKITHLSQLSKPTTHTISNEQHANPYNSLPKLEVVSISPSKRVVYKNNGVKLIKALKGDTYYKIAREFNVYTWQLKKYNVANKHTILQIGEWIYLEKKRNKAQVKYHKVRKGESLRSISQLYAIKMRKLMRRNKIKNSKQVLKTGQILRLR